MPLEAFVFEMTHQAIKVLDDRVTALEATCEDLAAGLKDHVAATADGNAPPATLTVELTYFKRSGKYHGSGTFAVYGSTSLHSIWDKVEAMRAAGDLPGLVPSNSGYTHLAILINVPDHPHEHPRLLQIPGHPHVD